MIHFLKSCIEENEGESTLFVFQTIELRYHTKWLDRYFCREEKQINNYSINGIQLDWKKLNEKKITSNRLHPTYKCGTKLLFHCLLDTFVWESDAEPVTNRPMCRAEEISKFPTHPLIPFVNRLLKKWICRITKLWI